MATKKKKDLNVPARNGVDMFKVPTHAQRLKNAAKDAMVDSTRRWCMGDIDTKQHKDNLKRAKMSLKGGM